MEKHKQIADQLRVVASLAKTLAGICDDLAPSIEANAFPYIHDQIGQRTAAQMEILGDMLNGMDAVDEEDSDWMDPIFTAAQELYPDAVREQGWFSDPLTNPERGDR